MDWPMGDPITFFALWIFAVVQGKSVCWSYKNLFLTEFATKTLIELCNITIFPGFLTLLASKVPPTIQFIKSLEPVTEKHRRSWGVYLLVLEKPGHRDRIYVGSATSEYTGLYGRPQAHFRGNANSSRGVRKAKQEGFSITACVVIVSCPMPSPKHVFQVRRCIVALEAFFHCFFWSMKEKHLTYGFLDLCPWSSGSMEYDGVNSHSPFIEECGQVEDPTKAEDRARVREERELQLRYRQEKARAREAEKQRVREEKAEVREFEKQVIREEKQRVREEKAEVREFEKQVIREEKQRVREEKAEVREFEKQVIREEKQRVREEKKNVHEENAQVQETEEKRTRKREAWRTQPWTKLTQEQKEILYAERAYIKLGWSQERRDKEQAWKTAAKLRTEQQNVETKRFFCNACNYNALSNASLNNHFKTKKHETNQDLVNRGIPVQHKPKGKTDPKLVEKFKEAREEKRYYCGPCGYAAPNISSLKDHQKSRRHLLKAAEAEKDAQSVGE